MKLELMNKLGVKQNVPKVAFTDYSGVIMGGVKIGKSTLASLLPKSVLVAFEAGYDALPVDCVDVTSGWADFIEFVDNLEDNIEEIGSSIRLIVWDTVVEAWSKCMEYTLKVEGSKEGKVYKVPSDIAHGGAYAICDSNFKKQLDRLKLMGFKNIYIAHTEVKTIRPKKKGAEPYDIIVSTLPDRAEKIIFPEVSYIAQITRAEVGGRTVREFKISGNDEEVAGSRVFFDEPIYFDREEDAVEQFQEKFKKVIEARIKKMGIKKSVEEIEVEQEEVLVKQVSENIAKDRVENVIEEINTLVDKIEDKKLLVADLKKNNLFYDYKEEKDLSKLKSILSIVKKY